MFTQNYKLNEQGLNHFFGPLEAKIMEIVWSSEGITIKEVQQKLSEESPVNFNTVMTVMNRLVEKLHLEKQTVKEVAYIVLYKQKKNSYPIKRRK